MKTPTFKRKGLAENLAALYEAYEEFERNKYSSASDFDETFSGPKVIDWLAAEPVINSVKKLFKDRKFIDEVLNKRNSKITIFENLFKNPVDLEKVMTHLIKIKYIKKNGFFDDEYGVIYDRYKIRANIYDLKIFIRKLNENSFFITNVLADDIDNILIVSFSEKKKHPDTKYRTDKKNPPAFEDFDFTPTPAK